MDDEAVSTTSKSEAPAAPLADGTAAFDTARIGRMGELVVEFELLRRGWMVGNFNHTVLNSAGFDLFATRGVQAVRIRVKAKRPGIDCFRWSAKADGRLFAGFDPAAQDDFVAAVSFEADGRYDVYILPTAVVEGTLKAENDLWLSGAKADGSPRKPTSMRHIYVDDRNDGTPSRGFAVRWASYRNAWVKLGKTRY